MYRKLKNKEEESNESEVGGNAQDMYVKMLKPMQFGERQMTNAKGEYEHNYKSRIISDGAQMSSSKAKRLIQEVATLSTGKKNVSMKKSDKFTLKKCFYFFFL